MLSLLSFIKGILVRNESDKTKTLLVEVSDSATTDTRTTLTAAQTADQTITLPDTAGAGGELVEKDLAQTLTNKIIDSANNTLTVDADEATVSNLVTSNLKAGVLVTDITTATSDTELPSALAVKTAVEAQDEASEIAYDNSTSGLAATEVQSAIDEVEGRVDTNESNITTNTSDIATNAGNIATNASNIATNTGNIATKADTDLNNLTATSINQDLVSANNTLNIGDNSNPWGAGYFKFLEVFNSAENDFIFEAGQLNTTALPSNEATSAIARCIGNMPISFHNFRAGYNVNLETGNSNSATKTGDVNILSGNNTSTGNSGDILLKTGDVTGGTKGTVVLQNGSEGTIGHVWASTDVTGGGEWTNPASLFTAANLNVRTVTTTDTVLITDDVVFCDSSGGAYTLTLPSAGGNTGKQLKFKKTTSDYNTVTIGTTRLDTEGEQVTLVSDGTNWVIVDRQIPSIWVDNGAYSLFAQTTNPTKATTPEYDNYYTRREGDSLRVRWQYAHISAVGTSLGTGEYYVEVPFGLTADTTKMVGSGAGVFKPRVGRLSNFFNDSGIIETDYNALLDPATGEIEFLGSYTTALSATDYDVWSSSSPNQITKGTFSLWLDMLIPIDGWEG